MQPVLKISISAFFFLFSICRIYGAAGTTGADFLNIVPDARTSAMGGTSAAVIDDSDSMTLNPASLAYSDRREFSLSTMKLNSFSDGFADGAKLVNTNAAYDSLFGAENAGPFRSPGNFGFSLTYADYGSVPVTTTTPDAEGSFTPSNIAAGIYWGNRFSKSPWARHVPFGIGVKYIHQNIGSYTSNGVAADIGAAYVAPAGSTLNGFTFGAALNNLGYVSPFIDEADPLPLTGRGGIAYRFFMNNVIHAFGGPKRTFNTVTEDAMLSLDVEKSIGAGPVVGIGSEFTFFDMLAVRTGYRILEEVRGVTLGMGFQYRTAGGRYKLDFAWVPQQFIGDSFRLTFNYVWGYNRISIGSDTPVEDKKVKFLRKSEKKDPDDLSDIPEEDNNR